MLRQRLCSSTDCLCCPTDDHEFHRLQFTTIFIVLSVETGLRLFSKLPSRTFDRSMLSLGHLTSANSLEQDTEATNVLSQNIVTPPFQPNIPRNGRL